MRSAWGTSQCEDKPGARDKILNTKVARRANIPPKIGPNLLLCLQPIKSPRFSVVPSVPSSLDLKFSLAPSMPLKLQHHSGRWGGLDPPPPFKGAQPCPSLCALVNNGPTTGQNCLLLQRQQRMAHKCTRSTSQPLQPLRHRADTVLTAKGKLQGLEQGPHCSILVQRICVPQGPASKVPLWGTILSSLASASTGE